MLGLTMHIGSAVASVEPTVEPTTSYLAATLATLHKVGLLDGREATLRDLNAALEDAQDHYVQGDLLGSATILLDLIHSPRFENFKGFPAMASVHYHLGLALRSYGAHISAMRAFRTTMAIGSKGNHHFESAFRRQVDLVLASHDYAHGLRDLNTSLAAAHLSPHTLTADLLDEYTYVQARAYGQAGTLALATSTYGKISNRSRFYTAALYLRGVLAARSGDFREAERAFCKVVDDHQDGTSRYFVDGRYFPIRDLAQLGLGRVAHEERRHGHAFYHYFQIPQESSHLPEALFESAWTMAEEGEFGVSRGLVRELRRRFPEAPQSVEARLLDALLLLYDCDFRGAEAAFSRFIDDLGAVGDHIDAIHEDPERIRALHRELSLVRGGGTDLRGELPAHRLLLYMIDEDPRYSRLSLLAEVLRHEAKFASGLKHTIQTLIARLGNDPPAATEFARTRNSSAGTWINHTAVLTALDMQLRGLEASGALLDEVAAERSELGALRRRSSSTSLQTSEQNSTHRVTGSHSQFGPIESALREDLARIDRVRTKAIAVATSLEDQAIMVAGRRLATLRSRIDGLLGEARMGRIDAVLGAKKKLEIEVQAMAAGRFPRELFGTLQIDGMISDDEEYWPYEGEYWADEYEGYR